jgi:hypothetical protein
VTTRLYANPLAFKQAVETRLKNASSTGNRVRAVVDGGDRATMRKGRAHHGHERSRSRTYGAAALSPGSPGIGRRCYLLHHGSAIAPDSAKRPSLG